MSSTTAVHGENESQNDASRRIALMQEIRNGIPFCMRDEHRTLYMLIRTECPDTPLTINRNGVFVPLRCLPTKVLEQCHVHIRHGRAQTANEESRQLQEQQLSNDLT